MNFKQETLQRIHDLAKDDRFGYVFDRLAGDKKELPPREILEGFANAFMEELGVPKDKMPALVLLLEMASLAAKPGK
jgi:hypothetical protein